jgi:hypothetical protein
MNAISTTSTVTAPAAPSREVLDLVARTKNCLEPLGAPGRFSISAERAPDGAERALLKGRLAQIEGALTPARPNEIAQRVGQMFLRFPSSRLTDATAAATVSAYVHDLRQFPVWALDEAIGGVIRRGGAFAPSSAELVAACGGVVARHRAEAADIRVILSAQIDAPSGSRESMMKRFSALVAELNEIAPAEAYTTRRPATRAEAQEWLEREREAARPLPKLSPALRAALGLPEVREEGAEDAA